MKPSQKKKPKEKKRKARINLLSRKIPPLLLSITKSTVARLHSKHLIANSITPIQYFQTCFRFQTCERSCPHTFTTFLLIVNTRMKRARSVTRTIQAGRNNNYDIPTLRHGRQVFELFTRVQSESLFTFGVLVPLHFGLKTARSKARSSILESNRVVIPVFIVAFVSLKKGFDGWPFCTINSILGVEYLKRDLINDQRCKL